MGSVASADRKCRCRGCYATSEDAGRGCAAPFSATWTGIRAGRCNRTTTASCMDSGSLRRVGPLGHAARWMALRDRGGWVVCPHNTTNATHDDGPGIEPGRLCALRCFPYRRCTGRGITSPIKNEVELVNSSRTIEASTLRLDVSLGARIIVSPKTAMIRNQSALLASDPSAFSPAGGAGPPPRRPRCR